jgi:PPOX class probable F420-dependent enzyme
MLGTMDNDVRAFFDAPNFCHVSTLKADGSVHAVIVWAHTEGDHVVLNSVIGRDWPSNLQRDPRVSLVAWDNDDPRNFARISGRLAREETDGAEEHIDFLAHKYQGTETYPYRSPGEVRVKLYVEPEQSTVFIGGSADSEPRKIDG